MFFLDLFEQVYCVWIVTKELIFGVDEKQRQEVEADPLWGILAASDTMLANSALSLRCLAQTERLWELERAVETARRMAQKRAELRAEIAKLSEDPEFVAALQSVLGRPEL